MSNDNVLPFQPRDEHDERLAQRIGALYDSTPAATEQQVALCTRTVRERAANERQRTFTSRPSTRWAAGLAAAAMLSVATMRVWRGGSTSMNVGQSDSAVASASGGATAGAVTADGSDAVRFDLRLPDSAKAVAIVGDFNGWNQSATPMAQGGHGGTWSAKVPLAPGRHVYAFVVNGTRWVVDPMAPQVPDDGYGPANAVVIDASSSK